ncbi:cupredoxin family copper-binding protein [Streptomyces sp. NBC_01537]|uniref:cupredoxin domain-containing protein n=1 Tax=Streptomyces sp. NBC_01537 TaxID=2903896 RepID=UPI0038666000
MNDDNESDARADKRRRLPARRGNRVLLTAGLAAAATAVACLALLQSTAGAAQTPSTAAPVADTQSVTQSQAEPAAVSAADAADYTIAIKDYAFAQKSLTVKVGDTVKWTNEDTAPHTVTTTSGPASFDSGNLSKGQSFSYTFTKAGTYDYYCAVHPDMTAKITVVDDSSGTSGGTSTGGTSGGSTTGGSTGGSSTGGDTTGGSTSGGDMGGMSGGSTSGGSTGGGTGGGTGDECYSIQQSLLPILQHINSAHLGESPSQQVQDALALDSYIKLHTVWIESIITPTVNGTGATLDQTLTVILQHINSAHLEESLGQQVADILNPDAYIKTHTVWAEHLLAPTESYLTTSC